MELKNAIKECIEVRDLDHAQMRVNACKEALGSYYNEFENALALARVMRDMCGYSEAKALKCYIQDIMVETSL